MFVSALFTRRALMIRWRVEIGEWRAGSIIKFASRRGSFFLFFGTGRENLDKCAANNPAALHTSHCTPSHPVPPSLTFLPRSVSQLCVCAIYTICDRISRNSRRVCGSLPHLAQSSISFRLDK